MKGVSNVKRVWCIFLVFALLLLSICGCQDSGMAGDPAGQGVEDDPTFDELQYKGVSVPFEAQYIRTNGGREGVDYPGIVIIRSVEELKSYIDDNQQYYDLSSKDRVYADTTIGFLDACEKYDEAYFLKQILIMVLLEEGSGSIRHEVEEVTQLSGGKLNIAIETITPEEGTCDMAQWHILIELDAGVDVQSPENVFINGRGLYGQSHTLQVQGEEQLLTELLQDTYQAGEKVTLRLEVPTEASVQVSLNGENLSGQTNLEDSCMEFSFIMPDKDSVVDIEITSVFPQPYYNEYYDSREDGALGVFLFLSDDFGEFMVGYRMISSIQMGGTFRREDNRLILEADGKEYVFAVDGSDLLYLAEESAATRLFYDGMILSLVRYTACEPPAMKLVVDGNSTPGILGSYYWIVDQGDGTAATTVAESLTPEEITDVVADFFEVTEQTGTLAFETDPDTFTVRCWNAMTTGDEIVYENVNVDGCDIQLKVGYYIYMVEAKWCNSGSYEGEAAYYLFVHYVVDEVSDETSGQDGDVGCEMPAEGFGLTAAQTETLWDILSNLTFMQENVCRCAAEYEFTGIDGTSFGINLIHGFVRCDAGQAELTPEQIDILAQILG